jgi:ApaG protein
MVITTGIFIRHAWLNIALPQRPKFHCQSRPCTTSHLPHKFAAMPATFGELNGLSVTVDRVAYMPTLDAPPDKPFPFVYFITIHNGSNESVTIRGRKWVVSDLSGEVVVVEGDGVVGKTPLIEPGQSFSYNSYHVIATDSVAEGAFIGLTEQGQPVIVRIPRFEMLSPEGSDVDDEP